MTTTEDAARVAYDAVRGHQLIHSDPVNPPWEHADAAARRSYVAGAELVLAGMAALDRHGRWVDYRRAEGWTWGPVKDEGTRTHPWLVDWADLPDRARDRSRLFGAAVAAAAGNPAV